MEQKKIISDDKLSPHEKLQKLDPCMAAKLHPNNIRLFLNTNKARNNSE